MIHAVAARVIVVDGLPITLTARRPAMGQARFRSHGQRHDLDLLRHLAKTLPTRHRRFDRGSSDGSEASQCRLPGSK